MGQIWYEQIIQNPELIGKISSILPALANFFTQFSPAKTIVGMSAKRALPKVTSKPLCKALHSNLHSKTDSLEYKPLNLPNKIAYFHGCFANFYSVEDEGLAVINLLERNGIKVMLPKQRCCGGPKIANGNLEAVYDDVRYNINQLSRIISEGYSLITSCPTCCLILKEDYPYLMNTEEAKLVAQNTYDIHQFLWNLFTTKRLKTDFKPLNKKVIYHQPCHLTAIGIDDLPVKLLNLIPEIDILHIEDSCCGMGGTFGLKKERFELSMEIGDRLFQQIKDINPDVVITPCAGCKMQIEQGAKIKVYHPINIIYLQS